jgi:hypothetical protein
MSTTATTQTILTVIKDEFAEVITEETLSPTNKPTDWNVVITEKALLKAMRTPSPPEEIRHDLATLYENTFSTAEEYREFTVNHLIMWGNTLDYKLFDTLYMTHQHNSCTVKKLSEQAMALLEEANKINKRDLLVRHKLQVMSEISLDLTFSNKSRNHNEFKLWSLLLSFPDHLVTLTIPIGLLMVTDTNINVFNVVTPPISNGTALFILVEPAIK